MTAFSVATFNIGNGTGADLMKVAAPADVVCCQEASDRSAMLNAFTLQNPDWISFRGDVTGGPAVPVLLDTAALGVPVAFEAVPAVGARQLGTNGTPPAKSKPKVITHVTLANGAHLLNTHFIPSATKTKAVLGAAEWKARRDHYRDHVAAIVTLADTLDGPVILTGDFNATPEFELLQPLHDLGFTGWTTEGTHGARAIDHVLFLPNRGVTWTARAVLGTASDHDAVVSTFELEEPPMPGEFCPFATIRNIPPGSNDPAITPRIAILHVDAGNAESLYDFFKNRSGGIESHFFIKKTGEIEQYRSIRFQADANLDANDFAVSIETQGFGAGEWNDAQLTSIKRLLTWLHEVADIPLRKVQNWDGSGVGYHVMFGAPGHWTPVAKTCPGPDRIKQFDNVLVPWMRDGDTPPTPPPHAVVVHRPLILAALDAALADISTRRAKVRADIEAFKETVKAWPED